MKDDKQNDRQGVTLSEDDTAHLLSSPANAQRLLESVAEFRAGKTVQRELIQAEMGVALSEREAFEAWLPAIDSNPDFTMGAHGFYDDWDVQRAWVAWQARASSSRAEVEKWRHVKSGGIYDVLIPLAYNEADTSKLVVYRSEETGFVWVRPHGEFHDKFLLAAAEAPNGGQS